ncbi:aminopeptidase [Clostridium gasigenes]|uniref:Aminopeptidase II. Metallo peptidase. MEROPS family M29 n=1 Tax=Clostridium gasigenes TaxID=94869 RepID=A0A1H0MGU6_9CLOT|nr:aminopeptidase [Clostridium gasigenes]MBB6622132.1 aminopeptidase [Clostridium gasigenes]MBU3086971.1 aminopeptidase [Clostridium gasigenes]SDO79653.1 aminopeptidase II. Metallo peptidase. MEROPS family M29 [Clostridium gasigenes]
MSENQMLKKYATLAVKMGVNIQTHDTLVINSPIDCSEFARAIATAAYKEGAKNVVVHYNDQKMQKIILNNSSIETLSDVPNWVSESYNSYARDGANFISISSSDPDAFKGVPVEKIAATQKAKQLALKEYYEKAMSNKVRWCVLSVPSEAWASKIFPELTIEEAMEKLWSVIFSVVRVDTEDPVEAWVNHNKNLNQKISFLNRNSFETLHYKNNKGTNLTVELPTGHLWLGGGEKSTSGIEFNANMPTEEVFTLPKRDGVNGRVVSSKPLSYGGNLINDFSLTFKDGKVIDFSAKEGGDVLKQLLDSDESAKYLGEVALVPMDSPISNSGIVFYNTLFDENAACHFAFGKAYPCCLAGGTEMTDEELAKNNVNNSIIHVDFMIGTDDLEITGITKNKDSVTIFKNGNWAF